MENQRAGRLTLPFGGLLSPGGACLATTGAKRRFNPPDERKEGVADAVSYTHLLHAIVCLVAAAAATRHTMA